MSKKKKHPKKKSSFAPPLSKLDKWIYKIGYVVIVGVSFLAFFPLSAFLRKIAYSDPMVVASYERGTLLWILPLWLYMFLSAFIIWNDLHVIRQPIFGNPDVTYGKAPWQNVYPLFSKKRKKRELRPSYKKYKREMLLLWFGGFLLCLFLAIFSLFGRVSLMQNGDVTVYGVFNNEKQTYSVENISEFEVKTGRYSVGKSGSVWRAAIVLTMDDEKTYAFSSAEFSPNIDAFEGMMKMKTLVDSRKITITGTENLDKVIEDHNYTPEEIKLLYKLFE